MREREADEETSDNCRGKESYQEKLETNRLG